jgi:hypothetical protein
VLIVHSKSGCVVRYLGWFGSMTVAGRSTKRAKLENGDVVESGGLTLTFMDDVA